MEEQLISFETAKLAKEKGFNEYCYGMESLYLILEDFWAEDYHNGNDYLMYKKGEIISSRNVPIHLELKFELIGKRPTQSLLQKWLRDVHNIHIEVVPDNYSEIEIVWCANIINLVEFLNPKDPFYYKNKDQLIGKSYEEVLEVGLQFALNLIPDKI